MSWTEKHYKQYDTNVWVTWNEAGLPLSVHCTEKEAQAALIAYGQQLDAYEEALVEDYMVEEDYPEFDLERLYGSLGLIALFFLTVWLLVK